MLIVAVDFVNLLLECTGGGIVCDLLVNPITVDLFLFDLGLLDLLLFTFSVMVSIALVLKVTGGG